MARFVIDKKIKLMLVLLVATIGISFLLLSDVTIFADSDNDGVSDSNDNCPLNVNLYQTDSDLDKVGDECDTDDDNDGVSDSLDQFDTNPKDWADFDFDGVGLSQDTDDDNDGILDTNDPSPLTTSGYLATKYLKNIETCAEVNDSTLRLVCYSEFFGTLTENEPNNTDALDLSIALSKIGTIDDCHFISHQIGHVAYEETSDVTKSLQGMDGTLCRGGYFHGVLSSYFHNIEESGKSFPDSHQTICDNLIGSSNYQDCVHGLGHGFVHYFGYDLNSSLEACHVMSFYQNILCVKGVMMQYTDNVLTRDGISKDVISYLCDSNQLEKTDYIECSMSTGSTLAFFTSHDFEKGKESCDLIEDKDTRNYCIEGLRLEIQDSEKYESNPLTEDIREKFQPQFIEGIKPIDIRSPAKISDFKFIKEVGLVSFSIDKPQYVIMYIPSEFVAEKILVTVNGQIPTDLTLQDHLLDTEMTMISFVPRQSGTVLITPIP
jgi:hypothetical protein